MTLKENILRQLLNQGDQAISGQSLCDQFGVSRTAVWKAIQALKKEGYLIEAKTNKGYQLLQDQDSLDESHIRQYLKEDVPLYLFETIDSTNNYAKKIAIDDARHGSLIVANHQSAGRGRQGHTFYSPADKGIYMTILLRPKEPLQELLKCTLAAGVATCQAIEELCSITPQIKWVNDIFIDKKKICGILTEATSDFESQQIDSVIVGIGINCKPIQFPEELKKIAGSLDQQSLHRAALVASIYTHFMHWMNQLSSPTLLDEYKKRSLLIGKEIIYTLNNEKKIGKVLDINQDGNLVLQQGNKTITLYSGEVSVKDWN